MSRPQSGDETADGLWLDHGHGGSFPALLEEIRAYQAQDEIEDAEQKIMLDALEGHPETLYRRSLLYHLTASAWIVNSQRDKVLLAYHRIYDSWAWCGGHADGDALLLRVALREAGEESGLTTLRAICGDCISLEILDVRRHTKRGKHVPAHLHFNLTYLLEADEKEALRVKEDENSALRWFPLEEAVAASSEAAMRPIYAKLNRRIPD